MPVLAEIEISTRIRNLLTSKELEALKVSRGKDGSVEAELTLLLIVDQRAEERDRLKPIPGDGANDFGFSAGCDSGG